MSGAVAGVADEPDHVAAELQAILDATMDVVAVFDSDRRSVNDAACGFYWRTREQLVGMRLDDLIGTERAEADWEGFLTDERIAQWMLEYVWEGEQDGRRACSKCARGPSSCRAGTCSCCAT